MATIKQCDVCGRNDRDVPLNVNPIRISLTTERQDYSFDICKDDLEKFSLKFQDFLEKSFPRGRG